MQQVIAKESKPLPWGNMVIRVECNKGFERIPHRFYLKNREITVEEIVDRWISTDYQYFKVRGSDGGLYILKQEEGQPDWQLTLFDTNHLKTDYDPKVPHSLH